MSIIKLQWMKYSNQKVNTTALFKHLGHRKLEILRMKKDVLRKYHQNKLEILRMRKDVPCKYHQNKLV